MGKHHRNRNKLHKFRYFIVGIILIIVGQFFLPSFVSFTPGDGSIWAFSEKGAAIILAEMICFWLGIVLLIKGVFDLLR